MGILLDDITLLPCIKVNALHHTVGGHTNIYNFSFLFFSYDIPPKILLSDKRKIIIVCEGCLSDYRILFTGQIFFDNVEL